MLSCVEREKSFMISGPGEASNSAGQVMINVDPPFCIVGSRTTLFTSACLSEY